MIGLLILNDSFQFPSFLFSDANYKDGEVFGIFVYNSDMITR